MIQEIKNQIEESINTKKSFSEELIGKIEFAANKCIEVLKNNRKFID